MNVSWMSQSADGTALEVVQDGRRLEVGPKKAGVVLKINSFVLETKRPWSFVFKLLHPLAFGGSVYADQKGGDGRYRPGIFLVEYRRGEKVEAIVQSVMVSLDVLGIEITETRKSEFMTEMRKRLNKWRKNVITVLTAAGIVSVVVASAAVKNGCQKQNGQAAAGGLAQMEERR